MDIQKPLVTAAAVGGLCSNFLRHVVLTVQGGVYPKLAGHIAHFLAQTLFKTCLIALTTAEYRWGAIAVLHCSAGAFKLAEP